MKRFAGKIILLLVVALLCFASSSLAENRRGAFTLSPMIGGHLIDGGMDLDSGASFGLSLGYNVDEHWGIEADLRYTPSETDRNVPLGGDADADIWIGGLSLLYHFQPEEDLNPYLAIGGGGIIYEIDGTSSDDEDYMAYYGGGLKYAIAENTALRLDVRHIINHRGDKEFTTGTDAPSVRHHLTAMLGLTFQFGGATNTPYKEVREAEPMVRQAEPMVQEKPAPPAPAPVPVDSDQDGVLDPSDKCPGTAPGVRVDQDGCPKDTDGDGVPDYKDACRNTPKGAKVDEKGCPEVVEPIATLALRLNFGVDKAAVTPFHYRELDKAADFIKKYPGHKILVVGHTDSTGAADYNQDLSAQRAENVRKSLISKYGVSASRITARGEGENTPVASNDTAAGRQENRRVEINILP